MRLLQQCSQRQGVAASCPPLLIAVLLECPCGSWLHGMESARSLHLSACVDVCGIPPKHALQVAISLVYTRCRTEFGRHVCLDASKDRHMPCLLLNRAARQFELHVPGGLWWLLIVQPQSSSCCCCCCPVNSLQFAGHGGSVWRQEVNPLLCNCGRWSLLMLADSVLLPAMQ